MGASMTGSGYGMAVYDSGVAGSFAADGQFYEYQPGYRYGTRVVVCGITLAPSYMCACVWLCVAVCGCVAVCVWLCVAVVAQLRCPIQEVLHRWGWS